MMKKNWLVLFPDTFLWIKDRNGIIYNSKNYKHFTFQCTESINKLCDPLFDLESLYSIEIAGSLLNSPIIKKWVNQITDIEAGCLIENNGLNKKVVSYYPLLSIQNGHEQIKWEHKLNIGGKIINYLHELVFYVNGSKNGSNDFFRQTYYSLKTNDSLDFNSIKSFIDKCNNEMLNQVTIIGDLIHYESFKQLQDWSLSVNFLVQFVILAEDIEKDIAKFERLNSSKIGLTVIVNNHPAFLRQSEVYQNISENVTFVFPVKSIDELDSVTSTVKKTGVKNYNIVPLYDGINEKFFEENVFMTKDEFKAIELTKREIFTNMTLNIHSFGKLTIMPDGKIHSNVNNPPLGVIGDTIYDLIYKEMTEGESWFRIRDMEPCYGCVYQWLCPSPGNYEQVMGKPNLCHVSR